MTAVNFPAPSTQFIGRQTELAEITGLLSRPDCRMLTLIGPGGIGKTRLALEAAGCVSFHHGAYFVGLQPLNSPDSIISALANTLKYTFYGDRDSKNQIIGYLREKELLLIFDNFEHLLDGADILAEILDESPKVKMLITSRERLNLREEWLMDIHGLSFPDGDQNQPVKDYAAVEFFTQSARRAGYTPQAKDNEAIARICRLLEGIPLAIELSAGWVRMLSCAQIVSEIGHSLDILSTSVRNFPEKHRSMRAAFEQSWALLSDAEKNVFMKLAVFRGGFTRDAAERVAGASLPVLVALVNKSLLRLDTSGRYNLHELLRQYAEEQLARSDQLDFVRDAHSRFYAEFGSCREEDLKGRNQLKAVAEIALDFENMRVAWFWAAANHHRETIETMIPTLDICAVVITSLEEAVFMLFKHAEPLFAPLPGQEPDRLWGRLLARVWDDVPEDITQARLETALQIARQYDDLREIAYCLQTCANLGSFAESYADTKALLEQSLNYYQQLGDRYSAAMILYDLSALSYDGTWEDMKRFGETSYQLRQEIGDLIGATRSSHFIAIDAARQGHFAEAEHVWANMIKVGNETENIVLTALGYTHLAHKIYLLQGDFDRSRAISAELQNIATTMNYDVFQAWSLACFGALAVMDEGYEEALVFCSRGATTVKSGYGWIADFAAWGTALAACGLTDYAAAKAHLPMAIRFWQKLDVVGTLVCLPIVAILMAYHGQQARAVELLSLAFTHPIRASGWMKKWPLLTCLQADLEQRLGAEAYANAWERGKKLETEGLSAKLLVELEQPNVSIQPAQTLVDPLTQREIEILCLVAEGMTNREVGERLYLATETIRWYMGEIFSKLGVHNRTHAVKRARELGII